MFAVVPVTASVSADETEALKAEITKAVEKVQEAGRTAWSASNTAQYSVHAAILMQQKVTYQFSFPPIKPSQISPYFLIFFGVVL